MSLLSLEGPVVALFCIGGLWGKVACLVGWFLKTEIKWKSCKKNKLFKAKFWSCLTLAILLISKQGEKTRQSLAIAH